jgi:hypothetical protein
MLRKRRVYPSFPPRPKTQKNDQDAGIGIIKVSAYSSQHVGSDRRVLQTHSRSTGVARELSSKEGLRSSNVVKSSGYRVEESLWLCSGYEV